MSLDDTTREAHRLGQVAALIANADEFRFVLLVVPIRRLDDGRIAVEGPASLASNISTESALDVIDNLAANRSKAFSVASLGARRTGEPS